MSFSGEKEAGRPSIIVQVEECLNSGQDCPPLYCRSGKHDSPGNQRKTSVDTTVS